MLTLKVAWPNRNTSVVIVWYA